MKDDNKTKKQLIDELTELRSQNAALKTSITGSISAQLAIEELQHYAESSEFAENVINIVCEPLTVLDQDLRVVKVSSSFYDFFKVSPEETMKQLICDLGNKQRDIPVCGLQFGMKVRIFMKC